jgi:hypothetical protein
MVGMESELVERKKVLKPADRGNPIREQLAEWKKRGKTQRERDFGGRFVKSGEVVTSGSDK